MGLARLFDKLSNKVEKYTGASISDKQPQQQQRYAAPPSSASTQQQYQQHQQYSAAAPPSAYNYPSAARQQQQQQEEQQHRAISPNSAMSQALSLVSSAVEDLRQANSTLTQAAGIIGALKTASSAAFGSPVEGTTTSDRATWTDAGKAVTHDGRLGAKALVQSAHAKYERANELLGGRLPQIEMAAVQPNKMTEAATAMGGSAGATASGVAQGALKITGAVMGVGAVGPISMIVKRSRTKKAVKGVAEMLQAYQQVLAQMQASMPPAVAKAAAPMA
jgi:hypothetical protein